MIAEDRSSARRVFGVVSIALLVLALAASGGSAARPAQADVSPDRTDGARVSSRIGWRGCGVRLQCSRVRVPLDWGPCGPTISLPVIRYLASRPRGGSGRCLSTGAVRRGVCSWSTSEGARLTRWGRDGSMSSAGLCVVAPVPSRWCGALPMRKAGSRFWDGLSIPSTRALDVGISAKDGQVRRPTAGTQRHACSPTSRPPTMPVISTICADLWATGDSPTGPCRTARFSARPTPTCFRAECVRWPSTVWSTRES